MTFTCNTARHLANMALYYADKASANYAQALAYRGLKLYPALVVHYAELGAHYAESARFYRDRLDEWRAGEVERAARWEMAKAA